MKEFTLPIYLIEDGEFVSAICPALNLAGQGHDKDSAVKSFVQVVEIFFEETARKGTLGKILRLIKADPPRTKKAVQTDIPSYLFERREISVALPSK